MWPLSQETVQQVIRVRLKHGPHELLNKFKELKVRAHIVRGMAYLYIKHHMSDLGGRPGVLSLHAIQKKATVTESLQAHVDARVSLHYPSATFNSEGAVPETIATMVQEQAAVSLAKTAEKSGFEMKQPTMPDAPCAPESLFENVRPVLVVQEATMEEAVDTNTALESTLGNLNEVTLNMSNKFENQYTSQYMARIFPASLNYDCGGADYPELFESFTMEDDDSVASAVRNRWRRLADEAILTPGLYKQMLANRSEKQIAGEWFLVPAAQNLHWRWMVLRSAFLTCKRKVAPGDTLNDNLIALIEAAKTLWQRMKKGTQ